MEEILVKNNFRVVRMANKSLVFNINGEDYFASKRVANDILEGRVSKAYVTESDKCSASGIRTKWLATPSVF